MLYTTLDFEVTREKKGIDFYFILVPLRNKPNKKVFKYGTPEPSYLNLLGCLNARTLNKKPCRGLKLLPILVRGDPFSGVPAGVWV